MTNRATDHALTAEGLAIGGLEEKQKRRLVPRPRANDQCNAAIVATTNRIMSSESKASSSSVCLPTGDDHGRRKALHPRPDVHQDGAIAVLEFRSRTTTLKV